MWYIHIKNMHKNNSAYPGTYKKTFIYYWIEVKRIEAFLKSNNQTFHTTTHLELIRSKRGFWPLWDSHTLVSDPRKQGHDQVGQLVQRLWQPLDTLCRNCYMIRQTWTFYIDLHLFCPLTFLCYFLFSANILIF